MPIPKLPKVKVAPLSGVAAPDVMTRSQITDLANYVREREGAYGAQRVERAADEIPNLGKLYTPEALRSVFSPGDNATAVMTMNPADFEKYARPIDPYLTTKVSPDLVKDDHSTADWVKHLQTVMGYDQVPYLVFNKGEAGADMLPIISGHEGRHRNRALAERGTTSALIQFQPRAELREPFPRRSQEQYIDAIRKEMQLTGNRVKPEQYYDPVADQEVRRRAIAMPDLYAAGGLVDSAPEEAIKNTITDPQAFRMLDMDLANLALMSQQPQRMAEGGIAHMDKGGKASKDDITNLKPQPKTQDTSFASVRSLLADIGRNQEEYERIAQGGAFDRRKFTPENIYAMRLLQAANATPDPARYLESLNPYLDSQLQFELNPYSNVAGYVLKSEPNKVVIQRLEQVENTIPHELTHTLQLGKGANPDLENNTQAFARARGLPADMKSSVFPSTNVTDMTELWGNVNARAHLVNAAGGDFINSPEGKALFPTNTEQRDYYANAMPGVNSITPDTGTFVPNNESYLAKAKRGLGMAEGGQASLDQMRYELERNSPVMQATPRGAIQDFIGTAGGYMDQAGKFVSEAIAPTAEKHPVKHFLADILLASPLKGAGTLMQDLTGTVRETDEDNPVRGVIDKGWRKLSIGTEPLLDPRALDIAQFGVPAAKVATKLVRTGAKAIAPFAKSTAEMANELYASGQMPGMVSPNAYVVKPKGGNWLPGSVERGIEPLKDLGFDEITPSQEAVTNWVDKRLGSYIKNEMGTPGDPVRALADKGTLHVNPNDLFYSMPDEFTDVTPGGMVATSRTLGGFPIESASNTYAGRNWEATADMAIKPVDIENLNQAFKEPWMDKLPSGSKIYAPQPGVLNQMGFEHLVDELHNATSATTALPANLRIDPAKLERMTMPEAVQHVAKINEWRAAEAVKAEKKGMMENLSATPRFEVPEAPQLSFVKAPGMKWIDVPDTTDPKGLKLCTTLGKQGGWCTMDEGKGKPYGSGENRLTTLIDADGRPHAQAKITQVSPEMQKAHFLMSLDAEQYQRALQNNGGMADEMFKGWLAQNNTVPPDITELKPPGNSFGSKRANTYEKRDPEYKTKVTDSVLKFLNAGEWGKVHDLGLYGILDTNNRANLAQELLKINPNISETIDVVNSVRSNMPRFITKDQLTSLLYPDSYARGGSVKNPFTSPKHSGYNIDHMRYELSRQG